MWHIFENDLKFRFFRIDFVLSIQSHYYSDFHFQLARVAISHICIDRRQKKSTQAFSQMMFGLYIAVKQCNLKS